MTKPSTTENFRLTLRLSEDQQAELEQRAEQMPLSTYVRHALFAANDNEPPKRRRNSQSTFKDRKALAQVLCKLGQSELSASMNEMARLAHLGALPVDIDTEIAIKTACQDIADMRRLLMNALGVQEG